MRLNEDSDEPWYVLMLGFIVKQPIHKTLRQMRFVTLYVIYVCSDIMYKLVDILVVSNELSPAETAATVGVLAAAIVTGIWKGISNLSDKHHQDD